MGHAGLKRYGVWGVEESRVGKEAVYVCVCVREKEKKKRAVCLAASGGHSLL